MTRRRGLAAALLALAAGGAAVGLAAAWAPDRPAAELAARWAPPPSTFVDAAGMRVHVRDEGPRDVTPVVLLHGTSASLHTWDGWTAALTPTHRVVRFDLPGFGLTGPPGDEDYSMAAYVRFVIAMLDRLGIERCVLAGNSLGGQIAWRTAVAHPGRVAALVLVDAAGFPFVARSLPLGFRLAQIPALAPLMDRLLPRGVVASSVRNVYGHPERVDDAMIDRYYELTLRTGNRRALRQRFAQAVPGEARERLGEITAPTLILWGGQDRLIPPDHADRFHAAIAASQVAVFADLGHVPHEEDPARTVEPVARLLADLAAHR